MLKANLLETCKGHQLKITEDDPNLKVLKARVLYGITSQNHNMGLEVSVCTLQILNLIKHNTH